VQTICRHLCRREFEFHLDKCHVEVGALDVMHSNAATFEVGTVQVGSVARGVPPSATVLPANTLTTVLLVFRAELGSDLE